jgi:hypothetical protein
MTDLIRANPPLLQRLAKLSPITRILQYVRIHRQADEPKVLALLLLESLCLALKPLGAQKCDALGDRAVVEATDDGRLASSDELRDADLMG